MVILGRREERSTFLNRNRGVRHPETTGMSAPAHRTCGLTDASRGRNRPHFSFSVMSSYGPAQG